MRRLRAVLPAAALLLLAAAAAYFLFPGGLLGLREAAVNEPYGCPMVEDAEVRSNGPGPCPKCGMELVPLSQTDHKGVASGAAKPAPPIVPAGRGTIFYCPMHPTYTSDRAGTCPICNMNLVPLDPGDQATASKVPGHAVVKIRPERLQLIGVKFGTATKQKVETTIRAVGRVDYDERRLSAVSLKVAGWIEELPVNATGQLVRKGDPLLVLYSPELLEAQRNFLLAAESVAAPGAAAPESTRTFAQEALQSARDRLLLWDLTAEQIAELAAKKEPQTRVAFRAKVQGIVTKRNVVLGGAVQPGMDLYEIADLSGVWVLADVYEYELHEVSVGQAATVTLATRPGDSLAGKVAYVYPYLNEPTRTVRVRIEVPNPDGLLRPGMYGNVELAVDLGERLVVDEQAVVDTGGRTIVFVALGEGRFEPREVKLGARSSGLAVIDHGLAEGEKIVTSGNFLVDSESRLKSALIEGNKEGGDEHAGHGGK
ncbi:MAG: efflux RND transporter periplasmic adaptor subunit [Planctomycetota bacterium]